MTLETTCRFDINQTLHDRVYCFVEECVSDYCIYRDCTYEPPVLFGSEAIENQKVDSVIDPTAHYSNTLQSSKYLQECLFEKMKTTIFFELEINRIKSSKNQEFLNGTLTYKDIWMILVILSACATMCFICSFKCRIPRSRVEIEEDYQAQKLKKQKKKEIKEKIKTKGTIFGLIDSTSKQNTSAIGLLDVAQSICSGMDQESLNFRDSRTSGTGVGGNKSALNVMVAGLALSHGYPENNPVLADNLEQFKENVENFKNGENKESKILMEQNGNLRDNHTDGTVLATGKSNGILSKKNSLVSGSSKSNEDNITTTNTNSILVNSTTTGGSSTHKFRPEGGLFS